MDPRDDRLPATPATPAPGTDRVAELLREVSGAGIAWEHPAIDYVEVQIDRRTWDEIQEWAAKRTEAASAPGGNAGGSDASKPVPPGDEQEVG